jgi:hypothetical protein
LRRAILKAKKARAKSEDNDGRRRGSDQFEF